MSAARQPWARLRAALTRRRVVGLALGLTALAAARLGWTADGRLAVRRPSHLILDRAERPLGEVPGSLDSFGFWPLPPALPPTIVATTLETEDRHFHQHPGVHLPSLARAAWQDLRNLRVVSGASTIAMQVARLQHPKSRTLWAKAREALEALLLVHRFGHEAVLRQYLTIAPYGNRCHGAARAARLYFDKPLEDLSWLQAAYLAALPQQPGRMGPWNPLGHRAALARARRILGQLEARHVITPDDLKIALESDLSVVPAPRRAPEAMHAFLRLAPLVAREPGVVHHTSLDLEVQRLARKALVDNLSRWKGAGAGNTAGVVVDLPSGEVLAYVGSADYFDERAHGAIDYLEARRSPGSALKPFVYGLALERGTHSAATEVADTPVEFDLPGGTSWVPENITHTFLGPMLLREALANSRNIPALRVLAEVGVDQVLDRLARGGVGHISYQPNAYGLTLAIGALPVTAVELATLYTALANGGQTIPLSLTPVEGGSRPEGGRVLSREAAVLVRDILSDPLARRPGFPAGGPLDFDYAVAIKTGTSQGYRDAWAAAFSDRLLVVTWVGNHDWRRMGQVAGATVAAPAAHRILDEVMPLRAPAQPVLARFPLPPSLVAVDVCALSGRLPGPGCTHLKTERFVPGTEPHEACPFHVEVRLDLRNGLRAGPGCPAPLVVTKAVLALPDAYQSWAAHQHLAVAPAAESPLCPSGPGAAPKVAIREPRGNARYLFDPDTPAPLSTVHFTAAVSPATEEVVWLVDGEPVGRVGWPHDLRWPMTKGTHVVRARLASSAQTSAPVTIVVDD